MNKLYIHELYIIKEINKEGKTIPEIADKLGVKDITVYKILDRSEKRLGFTVYVRNDNSTDKVMCDDSKEFIRTICNDLDWNILEELLFKGEILL